LKISYGSLDVLKGISLKIHKGDIYGLVGQSGVGKSTLLRCINGLQKYHQGSLKVNDVEVMDIKNSLEMRKFRSNIGMIFQHFSIMELETVYKNISIPLECWKYSREKIDARVKELVDLVGLNDKLSEKTKNLSGGQKQRVAIARALALDCKILLCDEATSALDPKMTKDILALLKKINEDLGVTIVMVTHEMSVVRQVCNRVAVLQDGKVAAEGLVEDILFDSPQAFIDFVGGDEATTLPDTGANIRIFYGKGSEPSEIFSSLTSDLGIKYKLVFGKIHLFRDQVMGSIYINIESKHTEPLLAYLADKAIKAEVMR
jgi:D-methionine transport system ATP-binding protein